MGITTHAGVVAPGHRVLRSGRRRSDTSRTPSPHHEGHPLGEVGLVGAEVDAERGVGPLLAPRAPRRASASGVIVTAARIPKPPAALVAAVRLAPETQPIPVCTTGSRHPTSSQNRVCSAGCSGSDTPSDYWWSRRPANPVRSLGACAWAPRRPGGCCSRRCWARASPSSTARSSTSPSPPSPRTSTPASATCSGCSTPTSSRSRALRAARAARWATATVAGGCSSSGWSASPPPRCCAALAPNVGVLIGARAVQGVGAALLVPGSLAIISAAFHPDDRAAAVGAWSGLGGVAGAIGPFVGGYLIDSVSWRLAFLINVPLARRRSSSPAATCPRPGPDGPAAPRPRRRGDGRPSAWPCATYALIEGAAADVAAWSALAVLGVFVVVEARSPGADAPAGAVPEPPVQRGQPHHPRRVRRPQRRLLPARPPAPGRPRLLGARGGGRAAARSRSSCCSCRRGAGALAQRIGPRLPDDGRPDRWSAAGLLLLDPGRRPARPTLDGGAARRHRVRPRAGAAPSPR